jgi:hypothetical protein
MSEKDVKSAEKEVIQDRLAEKSLEKDKANHDEYIRDRALTLSVESLKSAGHPNPVDVLNRADKFKAYILTGKIQ